MLEKRELSVDELEAERAAELPKREALSLVNLNFNIAPVVLVGNALAVNAATINSNASALVGQFTNISQFIH